MIIWINGAFGAGKTTIAKILNQQLAHSFLYDPENIGDFFRHNLPKSIQKGDFQAYPEWRQWNVQILTKLNNEYTGDIIAPMTLYKKESFDEIFEGLRKAGVDVRHFQLEVAREEIIERLQERNPELIEWGVTRVDEILAAFKRIPEAEKVMNQGKSPEAVAKEIVSKL